MAIDPRRLTRLVGDVASLPMIFTRINEAVNNPRSSMGDIAKVISEDTGLSARILRLANSAFYGYPGKIDTITQALTIIGTQQMRDLALATSIMKMFKNVPQHLIDMTSFWQHSIACGIAGRILATYRRESNIERYFVGGILHDMGRLVLYQQEPDEMTALMAHCESTGEIMIKAEKAILGVDHATLGGMLIEAWRLPGSLKEMVAYHHRPARAGRFPDSAVIIHLADIIAHVMELGRSGSKHVPILQEGAWERMGFSPNTLSLVIDQVQTQYESVVAIILGDQET